MNGWELNKIAAAITGASLMLGASWLVAVLLVPEQRPARPALALPAPATTVATAAAQPVPPIAARLAKASPGAGRQFAEAACLSCHTLDQGAPDQVGPNLFGVVGRAVAAEAGYDYSDALKQLGGRWTPERLDGWLTRPQGFAPGTRMGFAGIPDAATRADVVAFLSTLAASTPAPATAAPAASFEALVARSDPKAGAAAAQAACSACHAFEKDGTALVGPALWGVVGRGIGQAPDFAYSAALSGHGGQWNVATLDAWLRAPRRFAPGTRMAFAGLGDDAERAAVIAYLRTLSDTPR